MFEGGGLGLGRAPRLRPVGASVALAVFGLFSWWTVWGEGVEHVVVPDGFLWLCSVAVAGVLVARWLARWGVVVFAGSPRGVREWLGSGSALLVGLVLLVPGGECWFALRAVLAVRAGRAGARSSRAGRNCRAALWILWALSGLAGQVVLVWALRFDAAGADLAPDIGWAGAGVLNALSMVALMWWESVAELVGG